MTTNTLIEDVLRDYTHGFGFRLKWEIQSYWINVKAYEITSYDVDDYSKIYFHTKNAPGYPDDTERIEDADIYLEGYVKWDGCSELQQGQQYHWCGVNGYKNHIALLNYIYNRAMELMSDADTDIGGVWSEQPDYVYESKENDN
jgi:hypothetical protein